MALDKYNPAQNISYTNKDFSTLFAEQLDLVKQLTYKWDPSISNETDPGVILLKLNAIIADKCNYNIDKGVLECMPLSVTQLQNARQLFDQLGYSMRWYRGATVKVNLKWIDDEDVSDLSYTIPAFTLVSDADSTVLYTLIGPYVNGLNDSFSVGDMQLSKNGQIISFKAIQGVPVKYNINGETIITTQHLDGDNRIYFDDVAVAENGIFISNINENNYYAWQRKDNLLVETLGNTYYKFGVTQDSARCYLEFPEDAESIIKNGIEITYIRTGGSEGTIPYNFIQKLYNDLTPIEDSTVVLNGDNVKVYNISASSRGEDPESIDSAYRHYKHTVGTFNTLITLRDYFNAIVESGLVSNGFVCDRYNDIQTSYKIMTSVDGIDQQVINMMQENGENKLSAFSIKLYFTKYVPYVDSALAFDTTFEMLSNQELSTVQRYIMSQKCISHDYADILSKSSTNANVCFFKNKFPVKCKVTTTYPLSQTEASELVYIIKQSLYNALNASQIEFGQEIPYDYVYETIQKCDSRIKNVILDTFDYQISAVIFDPDYNTYRDIELHSDATVNGPELETYSNHDMTINTDATIWTKIFNDEIDFNTYKFIYTENNKWYCPQKSETYTQDVSGKLLNSQSEFCGITVSYDNIKKDDYFFIRISVSQQISDEILTKSVLAGTTQLFVQDEQFDYRFDQTCENSAPVIINNVEQVRCSTTISLDNIDAVGKTYTFRDNESVEFYAPNLIQSNQYSNNVRFEYFITNSLIPNENYELGVNEYIIFYWKDDENSDYYKYAAYGEGNIICPTFSIEGTVDDRNVSNYGRNTIAPQLHTATNHIINNNGDLIEGSQIISNVSQKLSGTKTISVKKMNQITLNSTYGCYWILNDSQSGYYRLFGDNEFSRILGINEYLIYTNQAQNEIEILGSGTKIVRNNLNTIYQVPAINTELINYDAQQALQNYWFRIPQGDVLDVVENQYVLIGSKNVMRIKSRSGETIPNITITKDGVLPSTIKLNDFIIEYKTDVNSESWVQLPQINLSNYTWDALSLYALNINAKTEQYLLSNQTLEYKVDGVDGWTTIQGSNYDNFAYSKVILSDMDIQMSGNAPYNTYHYDINGNKVFANFYLYKKNITNPNNNFAYTTNGGAIGYFRKNTAITPVKIEFALFTGNYIFSIINPNLPEGMSLEVSIDNKVLTPIGGYTPDAYMYYYMTSLNSPKKYNFGVTINTNGASLPTDIQIIIKNPYKYDLPQGTDYTEQMYENVKKLMTRFDTRNEYDYTYQVPSDKEIQNPLRAKEFFNPNHIANPYTIGYMQSLFTDREYDTISCLKVLGTK